MDVPRRSWPTGRLIDHIRIRDRIIASNEHDIKILENDNRCLREELDRLRKQE